MNKFKYELETKTEGDTITQTMYFYSDMDDCTQRELMYVNIMQTQDASQRQALENLDGRTLMADKSRVHYISF